MPYTKHIKQTNPMNLKALALATVAAIGTVAPASASPWTIKKISDDIWTSKDAAGHIHMLTVSHMDEEGDFFFTVSTSDGYQSNYWMDCQRHLSSFDGNPWTPIDHRKMIGTYERIVCHRNR